MTGDELRQEIEDRGLSIRQAARVLAMDASYIGRLMRGDRPINDDRADLIRIRLTRWDARQQAHR